MEEPITCEEVTPASPEPVLYLTADTWGRSGHRLCRDGCGQASVLTDLVLPCPCPLALDPSRSPNSAVKWARTHTRANPWPPAAGAQTPLQLHLQVFPGSKERQAR